MGVKYCHITTFFFTKDCKIFVAVKIHIRTIDASESFLLLIPILDTVSSTGTIYATYCRSVKEERVSYRESHKIEHLVSAGGNVRVGDDAGAAGRLHLEAVLHRGKRHVSASSPEDAGDDDRLHLLRTHGDGHENLRNREKARES